MKIGAGETFTIGNIKLNGYVNLFDAEEAYLDIGGLNIPASGTVIAPLDQFAGKFPAPIATTLEGKMLVVRNRKFRIAKASEDIVNITIALENPTKSK